MKPDPDDLDWIVGELLHLVYIEKQTGRQLIGHEYQIILQLLRLINHYPAVVRINVHQLIKKVQKETRNEYLWADYHFFHFSQRSKSKAFSDNKIGECGGSAINED